jgi:citrate lyase subunit beta / citryl-CoA lyase
MAEKATTLDAAEVILDLEDAVPNDPAEKQRAREQIVKSLEELDFGGRTVSVRINGVDGRHAIWDVLALVPQVADKISCLVVPKVSSVSEVAFIDHLLAALEDESGASEPIGLELQIEDPAGLEVVSQIAAASRRTEALIFGPIDFSAAMGMPDPTNVQQATTYPGDIWHYALFRVAVAAKACGLQVIDGPFTDIGNLELLEHSAQKSSQLGYDGKWVIHPSQLETVNRAFTPNAEEVRRAEQILEVLDARGGASRLGGEMVDEAHGRVAREVLLRARRIDAR